MQAPLLSYLGQYSWLPLLLVFVALPVLYVTLAIDVHKEYAELIKSAPKDFEIRTIESDIELDLHLFELDWWIVLAVALLFVGLFQMGDMAQASSFLEAIGPQRAAAADQVKSILIGYVACLGIVIAFMVGWARLNAARRLRSYYSMFRI